MASATSTTYSLWLCFLALLSALASRGANLPTHTTDASVIFIIKDSGGDCKGNIWIFLGWADKNSGPVLWKLTAFHLGIGENQKNEEVGIRMGAFVK